MNILKIVNIVIWALFTVGALLLTISDFSWFTLLMTIGCAGMTTISWLLYSWSKPDNKWPDGGDPYSGW